jgi:polysaccharide export outer membrane protein
LLAEIDAIQGQRDAEKQQIALVQAEIDQYSKLSERGLTKSSSMLELKLSLASRQSNVWRLEAERSRVQNSVMEFDRAVQELETTRKKQILTELQDTRQKLREIEATLPAAEEIREIRLRQTGGTAGAGVAREIVITRLRNNEVTTLAARETDSLEPGDIVEIKRLQSNAVAAPTAQTATGQKDAVQATTSPQ